MHKEKETRRKAIEDLPSCFYTFAKALLILEMLLISIALLSLSKVDLRVAETEREIRMPLDIRYEMDMDKKVAEYMAKQEETISVATNDSQTKQRKRTSTYSTKKSNVAFTKDNSTTTKYSNVTDMDVDSSEDEATSMDVTKETKVEDEKSNVDTTNDSTVTKESKEIETKENSSKGENSDVNVTEENFVPVEETLVTAKISDSIDTDTKTPIGDIVAEEIAEEVLVGAEESLVEENIVGSNEPIVEVEVKNQNTLRDANVELLANIMYAEEGVFLQKDPANAEMAHKLCGSVVLHRIEVNFGGATTMHEVLYAENQYASPTKKRIQQGQDIPDIVYKWAEELISNGPIGPRNLVYQAQFKQGQVYDKIGNQYFCLSSKYADLPQVTIQTVSPEPEQVVETYSVEPQNLEGQLEIVQDFVSVEP